MKMRTTEDASALQEVRIPACGTGTLVRMRMVAESWSRSPWPRRTNCRLKSGRIDKLVGAEAVVCTTCNDDIPVG